MLTFSDLNGELEKSIVILLYVDFAYFLSFQIKLRLSINTYIYRHPFLKKIIVKENETF